MGAFSNMLSGANGLFAGDHSTDGGVRANLGQMLQGASGVGGEIANIGKATSGVVPQTATGTPPTSPTAINKNIAPHMTAPGVSAVPLARAISGNSGPVSTIASPQQTSTIPTQATPTAPIATAPGQVPAPVGTGIGTYNPGDVKSVYGDDTGNAIGNLLNSENPTGVVRRL